MDLEDSELFHFFPYAKESISVLAPGATYLLTWYPKNMLILLDDRRERESIVQIFKLP